MRGYLQEKGGYNTKTSKEKTKRNGDVSETVRHREKAPVSVTLYAEQRITTGQMMHFHRLPF